MAKKFGVGIVGAGMALLPHALSLNAMKDEIAVKGLYTRTKSMREDRAKKYDFPVADTLEALLDDPEVDAIILLTPPNARLELVKQIAAADKHIFMEKPVERNTAAATELVEICEAAGVKLGITFQHRFRKSSIALRKFIDSGSMGDLVSCHLVVPWWRSQAYYDEPGRGTFEQDGGGVLITQAVHSMDLLLSFTGPVAQVQAMAGTSSVHDIETEDFVAGGLEFANGALGGIVATTTYEPGMEEAMTLAFTKGTAVLSGGSLNVHWKNGSHRQISEKPSGTGGGNNRMDFPFDWHRAQIEEFVSAVREDRDPYSNGRSALHVHRLIEALLKSAAEEKKVAVSR